MTFQGVWTAEDHGPVPGSAHFTTLVGTTHNSSVRFFSPGSPASSGVEQVAETGVTSLASEEIDNVIDDGNAFSKLVIAINSGATGAGTGEFTVIEDRPYLSFLSMIAPSPDWFVGLHDYQLFDNGIWVTDVTLFAGMYDAGSEDGDQFSGDNPDSDPIGNIVMLTESNASSLANGCPGIAPLVSIRLERIE